MDELVPKEDQPDQLVPQEDQPTANDQVVPQEDLPSSVKYGSTGQQALAGLEGAAQGVLGPLAPLAETKLLGVNPEDIAGRAAENPITHHAAEASAFVGSSLAGVGEAALLAKSIPKFAALGKVGSMALRGGLEMAALQGSDEISKRIINQPDPNESASDALAHMAYAGIMGAATGGLFGVGEVGLNKGLKAVENQKLVKRAQSFLSGFGAASEGQTAPRFDPFIKQYIGEGGKDLDRAAWKAGQEFQQNLPSTIAKQGIDKTVEVVGGLKGGLPGWYFSKKFIEPYIEKILQKPLTSASQKYVVPLVTRVLTSNAAKATPAALDYALNSARGAQKITNGLNMLFKTGGQQAFDAGIDQIKRDRIEQAINDGILDKQIQNQNAEETPAQFAEGGPVVAAPHDHFAEHFSHENMIMQSAKSRVYNHLRGLQPKPLQGGLAFDKNEPTREQRQQYDKALDLATNPLSILGKIKDGTVSRDHIGHLSSMWPELTQHLQKRITERVTESQLKGEKPSYKVRQGLSMLLGTPLETVMTPPAIQSAQAVFMPKAPQMPAQGAGKLKRGTSKLGNKTNKMYNTLSDAAEEDRTTRD